MQLESNDQTSYPKIKWDMGTAYDLFISLYVLHKPNKFGLPGAWAAGVRSRLPEAERELLFKYQRYVALPLNWIYQLPQPKDAETALYALKQIPVDQRIRTLCIEPSWSQETAAIMLDLSKRGSWGPEDLSVLKAHFQELDKNKAAYEAKKNMPSNEMEKLLDFWANAEEIGEGYLKALQAYYEVFYAEEEERILPKLEAALENAQEKAKTQPIPDLLEQLFQGLRFVELADYDTYILAPTFWSTPTVIYTDLGDRTRLLTFGARSPQDSLVPGEVIPDAVLQFLKAMSDPTRLRIMRYLTHEKLSPAELSRRLRLRAPTLTHHLHALRLAGLITFTLEKKNERKYSARTEAIKTNFAGIESFLEESQPGLESDQEMELGGVE